MGTIYNFNSLSFMTNVNIYSRSGELKIESQVSPLQTNTTQLIFQTSFVLEEQKITKETLPKCW